MQNTPQDRSGGSRLPNVGALGNNALRLIGIAVVVVVVICALCGFFVFRPGSNDNTSGSTIPTVAPTRTPVVGGGNTGGPQFGALVTTTSVGAKNAPGPATASFPAASSIIYAVIEGINIPVGTSLFARWSRGGTPFEDSAQITANQQYINTFIEFHLQPKSGTTLQTGNYTVQFFVNGNPGPQANFTVR